MKAAARSAPNEVSARRLVAGSTARWRHHARGHCEKFNVYDRCCYWLVDAERCVEFLIATVGLVSHSGNPGARDLNPDTVPPAPEDLNLRQERFFSFSCPDFL